MENYKGLKEWETWSKWFLLFILILAATLRLYGITALGLTHWDEGIYASVGRLFASQPSFEALSSIYDPRYAPPLFPILVGLSQRLLVLNDWAAIVVSAISGVLTIYLMYVLGKRLYGIEVGLLSALFVAINPYHVIYSRMALTDAIFLLFFLISLVFCYDAFVSNRLRSSIFAGVAAGLTMNTKYHGPIVLLIGLGSALVLLGRNFLLARWHNKYPFNLWSTIIRTTSFLVIGIILYLPWLILVSTLFGYDRLVSHHAGFTALLKGEFATSPLLIPQYFIHWTSPFLLFFAFIEIAIILYKRNSSDIFLLTYLIFYSLGIVLYLSYPRLALPLLPALAILAAIGITGLIKRVRIKALKVAVILLVLITAIDLFDSTASLLPVKYGWLPSGCRVY